MNVKDNDILTFSFIGMTTSQITIGKSSLINILLETSNEALNEVVMTAMGLKKQKRTCYKRFSNFRCSTALLLISMTALMTALIGTS